MWERSGLESKNYIHLKLVISTFLRGTLQSYCDPDDFPFFRDRRSRPHPEETAENNGFAETRQEATGALDKLSLEAR